jgi:hypothetical protein
MPWVIVFHHEFTDWVRSLDSDDQDRINEALEVLRTAGPVLGRPLVDHVKGSKMKNLKELRPLGSSIRCLFIFDSERKSFFLVGGNKKGRWHEWYEESIPIAESRFQEHSGKQQGKL